MRSLFGSHESAIVVQSLIWSLYCSMRVIFGIVFFVVLILFDFLALLTVLEGTL